MNTSTYCDIERASAVAVALKGHFGSVGGYSGLEGIVLAGLSERAANKSKASDGARYNALHDAFGMICSDKLLERRREESLKLVRRDTYRLSCAFHSILLRDDASRVHHDLVSSEKGSATIEAAAR